MMTNDTTALVDRLRDMEEWARDCGWHNHVETARDAIAAISRPVPVAADGCEPSQRAIDDVAFAIWDEEIAKTKSEPKEFAKRLIEAAYFHDLTPRIAAAYARGMEDAGGHRRPTASSASCPGCVFSWDWGSAAKVAEWSLEMNGWRWRVFALQDGFNLSFNSVQVCSVRVYRKKP
jgi:hypothetical protein